MPRFFEICTGIKTIAVEPAGDTGGNMNEYKFQEFPKMKYHPKLGTKIVQNSQEEKALGKGWYNNPGAFPKPSRIVAGLDEVVKPWWTKWQWIFSATALLVGNITAFVTMLRR
jgi:hypothetical protein